MSLRIKQHNAYYNVRDGVRYSVSRGSNVTIHAVGDIDVGDVYDCWRGIVKVTGISEITHPLMDEVVKDYHVFYTVLCSCDSSHSISGKNYVSTYGDTKLWKRIT